MVGNFGGKIVRVEITTRSLQIRLYSKRLAHNLPTLGRPCERSTSKGIGHCRIAAAVKAYAHLAYFIYSKLIGVIRRTEPG